MPKSICPCVKNCDLEDNLTFPSVTQIGLIVVLV